MPCVSRFTYFFTLYKLFGLPNCSLFQKCKKNLITKVTRNIGETCQMVELKLRDYVEGAIFCLYNNLLQENIDFFNLLLKLLKKMHH